MTRESAHKFEKQTAFDFSSVMNFQINSSYLPEAHINSL